MSSQVEVQTVATAHPVRTAMLLGASFLAGVGVALQSRVNGALGQSLGDGFFAAIISFGSGLVILVIALLFWRPGRVGIGRVRDAVLSNRIPWWYLIGGTAGAVFVLTQSLVVGLVGVALFTVGVVAGQVTSSLLVDRRGLRTVAAKPVTWQRLVGAIVALGAVVLAASPEFRGDLPFWVLVAPLLAGAGVGLQSAFNGQVRAVAGSALTATLGNFIVGTVLLLVVGVVHGAFVGVPSHFPAQPWMYTGGVIGCSFIAAQAVIVRYTGVLLMGLAVLSGQLITAVAFDLFAPVRTQPIGLLTVVGAAVTLAAVVIAAIPGRRSRA